jgi:hypothetical protein
VIPEQPVLNSIPPSPLVLHRRHTGAKDAMANCSLKANGQAVASMRQGSSAFESVLPSTSLNKVAAENIVGGRQMLSKTQQDYMLKVTTNELVSTLRDVALFSGLTNDDFAVLARHVEKSEYKRKQWVFKQGDIGDRFFIIQEGQAQVVRTIDGSDTVLKDLEKDAVFGERALLKSEPRFAGIRCSSATMTTLSVTKEAFEVALGPIEQYMKKQDYVSPADSPDASFAAPAVCISMRRQSTYASLRSAGLATVAASGIPAIRRHRTATAAAKKEKVRATSLIAGGRKNVDKRHATFADISKTDVERKKLLSLARETNPMDSILSLAALPRTVVPRILTHALTWLVVACYAAACVMTRSGVEIGILDVNSFDGSNQMITFMIIFYVGYCYSRYTSQFQDVEDMMHSVQQACVLGRVCFRDPDDVHRLWRLLNLLHLSSYTGLSPSYTEQNFFLPLCKRHDLLPKDDVQKSSEESAFESISHGDGGAACNQFLVWSLDIVHREATATNTRISPPMHAQLSAQILQVGESSKRLHAYTYQVLPYIYTHLVSLMASLSMLFNAFVKGCYFDKEASYTFGLILPFCSMIVTALAVFGLLEVGDTILDPFGSDPEDFTVLHFIEWTISSSLSAIETGHVKYDTPKAPQTAAEHAEVFYTEEETLAMVKVVARMVARHRARQAVKSRIMEESVQKALSIEQAKIKRDAAASSAVHRRPQKKSCGSYANAFNSAPSNAPVPAAMSEQEAGIQKPAMNGMADNVDVTAGCSALRNGTPPSAAMHTVTPPASSVKWSVQGDILASDRQELRQEAVESLSAQKGKAPSERHKRRRKVRPINANGAAHEVGSSQVPAPSSETESLVATSQPASLSA